MSSLANGPRFAIVFGVLSLTPCLGFIWPLASREWMALTLSAGLVVAQAVMRSVGGWTIVAPLLLYIPAQIVGDLFAHLIFGGCILY